HTPLSVVLMVRSAPRSTSFPYTTLFRSCINVPDTVGYAMPGEFAEMIQKIRENVDGIDKVYLSVHCHNDLGLAVANTLAAIRAGDRKSTRLNSSHVSKTYAVIC